jgi:AraC family transcriptional regulator
MTVAVRHSGARARSEVERCAAVDRVIAAMHERLDRPFTLDEMARIAYLSPFYFNRVFRQQTGVPPRRFHTALRVEAAKRLLMTTRRSVTEICLEVGYQSLGTFTTHFRELVGVSPRELRRLAADPWLAETEMKDLCAEADVDPRDPAVEGIVDAPEGSVVFIGLFGHPYPEGLPTACTARRGPGGYALRLPRSRRLHVAAAAFARDDTVGACLTPEESSVLVASGGAPVGSPAGRVRRDLRLRPLRSTDPPLLLALPLAAAAPIALPEDCAEPAPI